MNVLSGIYLLIWKNFKLKLRHPFVLLMEIGMPCLFSAILAIVRVMITFDKTPNVTSYSPMPVDNWLPIDNKVILYAPKSHLVDSLMTIFVNTSKATPKVRGFEDETKLVEHYAKENSDIISCGVVFQNMPAENFDREKLIVKIRFPFVPKQKSGLSFDKIDQFTWQTARLFPMFQQPGPRAFDQVQGGPPNYLDEGFLYVYHQIVKSILLYQNSSLQSTLNSTRINVQRFPYPPYIADKFLFALQFFFPLILMLSFIYPSVNLTKNIVLEKEQRLTQIMAMMGLRDWLHWTSWFVNSLFWSIPSLAIITVLLCVPFKPDLTIIGYSNPSLVFLFFLFYTVNSISFSFLVSTWFSRANVAGVISGAMYFITFLPYFQVNINYHDLTFVEKIVLCSIFNTNMGIGSLILSMWESEHVGLQWWNLFEAASPDDNLSFFHVLLMFLVNSVVYFLIALYIQNVFPGEFGIPKKWYFFVELDYWKTIFGQTGKTSDVEKTTDNDVKNRFESIVIENLSKSYDKGKTFSVSSLNLIMEKDEITVLLGHNGAGKTTLMSILCGLIPPTSGKITVDGRDLIQEMEYVRKNLGICPQFDVLFDHLTVSEHLWFYCKLKQIDDKQIQFEIDQIIKQLDLEPKRNQQAYTLSGGMKRKLSVGIALSGGSKFVLLDEPTSGMDVSARRFIWEILLAEKSNRTILLSTHFMEEADVLADKIAIVEAGKLKCFGTPMELKKLYGLGYLLTFATRENAESNLIHDLIQNHIPNAKLLSSVGTEVSFSLPESETMKFEKLFHTIEQSSERLGVISYAISVTTIEEVFLRVGDFAKEATDQFNAFGKENEKGTNDDSILEQFRPNSLKLNVGLLHSLQVYNSLLTKKLLYFIRNPFLIFAQFPMPSMLLFMAVIVDRTQLEKAVYSPAMPLSLTLYKTLYITSFLDDSQPAQSLSNLYVDLIRSTGHDVKLDMLKLGNNDTMNEAVQYLADFGKRHEAEYNIYYMMAALFMQNDDKLVLTAMFNNQAYHTSATSLAFLENVLLRYLLPDNPVQIDLWNEPFPRKQRDAYSAREFDSSLQVQLANSILFSTCILLSSFIILIVKEKESNFKLIQQISGLNLVQYWLSNFILDYLVYVISTLIMAFVVFLLRVDAFQTVAQLSYLTIVFVVSGLAALPFIYMCSAAFNDPATAYVRVSLYMLIAGQTTFLMVLILQIPDFDLMDTSKQLDEIFSFLLPMYTLSISVFSIYQNYKSQEFCLGNITFYNVTYRVQDFCTERYTNMFPIMKSCCPGQCDKMCFNFEENFLAWEKPGLAQYLLAFVCQAVLFWGILSTIESGKFNIKTLISQWTNKTGTYDVDDLDKDEDVQQEEARIRKENTSSLAKTDSLIVKNLIKKYGNFTAVNNISFGVKRGECFGILGINGAGKTTTFRCICGSEKITSGDIYVNGPNGLIDVKKHMSQVYKSIGYCPQFCGLLDQLTGRETLRIVSRIRGIDEMLIDKQVNALAQILFFSKHIDKLVSSYSGGTKRKLSFAVSCIGTPFIIFLDEPTTGVDPISRRCLWTAILSLRAAGTSLALTSHSMDEIQSLSNRLFIMIGGKIGCIASPLRLKFKYGTGYYLQLKLKKEKSTNENDFKMNNLDLKEMDEQNLTTVSNYLVARWPACTIESSHNGLLSFRLKTTDVKLSALFGDIERLKSSNTLPIEDYSISQTSLEQIFLSFARKQRTTI